MYISVVHCLVYYHEHNRLLDNVYQYYRILATVEDMSKTENKLTKSVSTNQFIKKYAATKSCRPKHHERKSNYFYPLTTK